MTVPVAPVPALPDRYADASFVAMGGSSTVYRARTTDDERVVAVKVFRLDSDRITQELDAAERLLDVDGVVPVLEHGQLDDGRRFLTTGFFALGTLGGQLEAGREFTPDEVAAAGARLATTLDAVHRRGVVHGDVKPSNILLDAAGALWLTDFGTARTPTSPAPDGPTLTYTVLYSAPEVLDGGHHSPRSDQYALGLVLATLLLGEHPYGGFATRGIGPLVDRVRQGGLPDLSRDGVATDLAATVGRATSIDPEDRFEDCGALADALRP